MSLGNEHPLFDTMVDAARCHLGSKSDAGDVLPLVGGLLPGPDPDLLIA